MKFEIAKEKLSTYLSQLSNVIEKNSPQPILTHIYLEAKQDEGKLQLTATDTEITLSALIESNIHEGGKITVPAERFIPLIKSLKDENSVYCEVYDGQFFVHTDGGKIKLATLPAEDFPISEEEQESYSCTVDALQFSDVLSKVRTAVPANDPRFYLNGVFIKKSDENPLELEAAATDGKRLAVASIKTLSEGDFYLNPFILPIKAVSTLINLLGFDIALAELKAQKEGLEDKELVAEINAQIEELNKIKKTGNFDEATPRSVVLKLSDRELKIEIGSYHFSTRLIDGEYPNYAEMIPTELDNPIQIGREDLQNILRRIQVLFQKSKEKYVSMRFEYEDMFLSARNELDESVEQKLKMVTAQGEIPQIAFNVDYLLGCIGQFAGVILKLHIRDAENPMMITAEDSPNLRFVVMSMRV